MAGVTYDTDALIAGERNHRRMWAFHMGLTAGEVVPVVPAPALAEAWRDGPHQANLVRMLAGYEVEPMSADQARQVGELAAERIMTMSSDVLVARTPPATTGLGPVATPSASAQVAGVEPCSAAYDRLQEYLYEF